MLGVHRRGGFVGEQVALWLLGDLGPCSGERDALLLSDAQVAIGCLAEGEEFELFEGLLDVCYWFGGSEAAEGYDFFDGEIEGELWPLFDECDALGAIFGRDGVEGLGVEVDCTGFGCS